MSIQGKVALVTGASRGIGRAIALSLAEHGMMVCGTATTEEGAENITACFKEAGLSGWGKCFNVNDTDKVSAFLNEIKESHGVIEVLVNNAAVTRDNLLLRMKEEEWSDVIDTNLNAVFRLTKACLRDMLKQHWGRIINISSIVAITGNAGQANYAAAKAGLIGFTKSLAQEVASRNITANVIAPGFFDTDMTRTLTEVHQAKILESIPMGRVGAPAEIAALADR